MRYWWHVVRRDITWMRLKLEHELRQAEIRFKLPDQADSQHTANVVLTMTSMYFTLPLIQYRSSCFEVEYMFKLHSEPTPGSRRDRRTWRGVVDMYRTWPSAFSDRDYCA